jgi:hypothetical protein
MASWFNGPFWLWFFVCVHPYRPKNKASKWFRFGSCIRWDFRNFNHSTESQLTWSLKFPIGWVSAKWDSTWTESTRSETHSAFLEVVSGREIKEANLRTEPSLTPWTGENLGARSFWNVQLVPDRFLACCKKIYFPPIESTRRNQSPF